MGDAALEALRRAVAAMPDDVDLRLHLAELEIGAGERDAAIATLGEVLARAPGNTAAQALMLRAVSGAPAPVAAPPPTPEAGNPPDASDAPASANPTEPAQSSDSDGFDWLAAEQDVGLDVPPPFVKAPVGDSGIPDTRLFASETSTITLADVGGMASVKERLEVAFLAPMRNPELRQLYGKSLRGGLLMYGPPGCGKTFIARAIAGELGASFLPIGIADVLDEYLGSSERNLHELFRQARRDAPCVVFVDELDTLGQRRSSHAAMMAGVVNQLLTELDGIGTDNEGVFVLAATNQPWRVDSALRRPGRFDRTVLVLPPDEPARQAIFRSHLLERPVESIDLAALAEATDGYTGADIAHICETGAEYALMDSIHSGKARMIGMRDLMRAVGEVRPSIGPWLETARNIVQFGEDDGTFAELRAYLKKARRL